MTQTRPNSSQPISHPLEALRRWENGHHLFFVLIQALIVLHKRLERELVTRDWQAAGNTMTDATQLWWACCAAFHFTGDFTAEVFDSVVRRSMEPPFEQEGFSGLHSADHAHLLQSLSSLKPLLEQLPSELRQRHRSYLWALDATYESHSMVCALHVGSKSSLQMNKVGQVDASAPEAIRALKARTLKRVGCPVHHAKQEETRDEN